MKPHKVNKLIVFFLFVIYYLIDKILFSDILRLVYLLINNEILSFFISYCVVGIPLFAYSYYIFKKRMLKTLGFKKNILFAASLALLFSLPMFIGYWLNNETGIVIEYRSIWLNVVFAAFFEELFYRGFFFGYIFKYTSFGFIPSIFIGALFFASIHLYQSSNLLTLFGVILTTFFGALLFAWLYAEWKNIWVSIFLHLFMNLSWNIFQVSNNAIGTLNENGIRLLTVFLAISITIVYKIKNRIPFEVNFKTLFIKRTFNEQIS